MLPESRLYSFMDHQKKFSLHFFEGQQLIKDLALIHRLQGAGFQYFRDFVLSVQPMIAFLKMGESFGFYLDAEEPYFRLKIETNSLGLMRSLLYPENFDQFPPTVMGTVRMTKILPQAKEPYSSLIQISNKNLGEIVNQFLTDSFQVNSKILVSEKSDQSLLLNMLPLEQSEQELAFDPEEPMKVLEGYRINFLQLFDRHLANANEIKKEIEGLGFHYLGSKEVKFQCGCSKERMIKNLTEIANFSQEDLFEKGQDVLEIKCDYCNAEYVITRDELQNFDQ